MRFINLPQQAHIVNLLPPVNITGGGTSDVFSMKNHRAANIIMQIGVSAAAPTALIVEACTDATGAGAEAIPYHLYSEETDAGDTFAAREEITAAGKTLSANNNIMYCAWVDSSWLPDGKPYLRVRATNGTNSVIASMIAILLGARDVGEAQNKTVLT
jgi:hypothetical protein